MRFNGAISAERAPSAAWHWAELHWSTNDPADFQTGTYVCPVVEPYSIEGELNGVEKIERSDSDLHSYYSQAAKTKGLDVNLHEYLVRKASDFKARRGFICSAVRQWVIVEIAPVNDAECWPEFDIWAFLQPPTIGKDAQQKQQYQQYVVDDIPRGGWFQARVEHLIVAEKPPTEYNPHLLVQRQRKDDSKFVEDCGPVPYTVVSDILDTQRHGRVSHRRYLFKVPVVIRNEETAQDRQRKNLAMVKYYDALAQDADSGFTEDMLKDIVRFETGSYLKVWVRNANWHWSDAAAITDDRTENSMNAMQRCDGSQTPRSVKDEFSGLTAMSDDPEDMRRKYDAHYFRPFAYRNHTWKRNLLSASGRYTPDDLYHVAVWPADLIQSVEDLENSLLMQGDAVEMGRLLGFAVLYGAAMGLCYYTMKKTNKPQALQTVVEYGNLPQFAAMFGYYGLPDKSETSWGPKKSTKTYTAMVERFEDEIARKPGLQFYYQFFCILHHLVLDSLSSEDSELHTDYAKFLEKRKKLKKTSFDKLQFDKVGLDGGVSMSIAEAGLSYPLQGSPLPHPLLLWLAWRVSLQAKAKLEGSMSPSFVNIQQSGGKPGIARLDIKADTSGDFGIYFDLGAAWTLAKGAEKSVAIKNASLTYKKFPSPKDKKVTIKSDGSVAPDCTQFQFADTIAKVFEYGDLQIGAAIKLEAKGSIGFIIDLENRTIRPPDPQKDGEPDPLSFVMSLSMPLYGKLSVLSKQFKAFHADLLYVTQASAGVLPNGLYLGNAKVMDGADDLRVRWKATDLGPTLKIDSSTRSTFIGDPVGVKSSVESLSAVPSSLLAEYKKKKLSEPMPVPGFVTFIDRGPDKRVELDTVASFRSLPTEPDDRQRFDSEVYLSSTLSVSEPKLAAGGEYGKLIKKLLKEDFESELSVFFVGDKGQSVPSSGQTILIKAPRIHRMEVNNISGGASKELTAGSTVRVTFEVTHLLQEDINLYCSVVELGKKLSYMGVGAKGFNRMRLKDDSECLYKCHSAGPSTFATQINLGQIALKGNLFEKGELDLSFAISLDRKSEYRIWYSNPLQSEVEPYFCQPVAVRQ